MFCIFAVGVVAKVILKILTKIIETILGFIHKIIESIIKTIIDLVLKVIKTVLKDTIFSVVDKIFDKIGEIFDKIFGNVFGSIGVKLLGIIKDKIKDIMTNIFLKIFEVIGKIFKDILSSTLGVLFKIIKGIVGKIIEKVLGVLMGFTGKLDNTAIDDILAPIFSSVSTIDLARRSSVDKRQEEVEEGEEIEGFDEFAKLMDNTGLDLVRDYGDIDSDAILSEAVSGYLETQNFKRDTDSSEQWDDSLTIYATSAIRNLIDGDIDSGLSVDAVIDQAMQGTSSKRDANEQARVLKSTLTQLLSRSDGGDKRSLDDLFSGIIGKLLTNIDEKGNLFGDLTDIPFDLGDWDDIIDDLKNSS